MNLHQLRHYSATELISAGVDVRTVAGRLGHGGGGTTTLKVYSAWHSEADQRAASALGMRMPELPVHVDTTAPLTATADHDDDDDTPYGESRQIYAAPSRAVRSALATPCRLSSPWPSGTVSRGRPHSGRSRYSAPTSWSMCPAVTALWFVEHRWMYPRAAQPVRSRARYGQAPRRETKGMPNVTTLERTLVILKPDAVQRGLMGRLVQRFEDAGLKVVGAKMKLMDADFTRRHYADLQERFGESVYNATATFMQQGPVMALVLEGAEAVTNVRRIVGKTFPNESAPGTIRGDFAHTSKAYSEAQHQVVANLVHASGNVEEAKYEVELWFDSGELFDYQTLAERFAF
jgi:nucleoside-diphosphate kinase